MIGVLRQRAVKYSLQHAVRLQGKSPVRFPKTEFYFGYGANLSEDRFQSKRMQVAEVGVAHLTDHQLTFELANEYRGKGYASVAPVRGQNVWGMLYKMDALSLKLLDSMEWAGLGAYERRKVPVVLSDGPVIDAWCYIAKDPKGGLKPSKAYLDAILSEARRLGFPEDYISYLEAQPSQDEFPLDHEFSLLFYGKKRPLSGQLEPVYKVHDRLRQKLTKLI